MADGISVSIGADTRAFDQGVRNGMVEPVEDAQKVLDQYADAGADAGDKLERTFRDQQRSTGELQQDLQDLNRTIKDGSGPAYKQAQQHGDDFTRKTSEGFQEVKESAKSNAIALGASFTGGFDQAAGGLQGFLSEFLAGFGPAGIVAGIGAAIGIGLITAQLEEGKEKAEEQKQAAAELAAEWIEAGTDGRRSIGMIADALRDMATATEEGSVSLADVRKQAEQLGVPFQALARAYVENGAGQDAMIRKTRTLLQAERDRLFASQLQVSQSGGVAQADNDRTRALAKLLEQLEKARTTQRKAAEEQADYAATGAADLQATASATEAYADSVQSSLTDAGTDWEKYQDKQGVNLDKYNAHMEKAIQATAHYQENVAAASQTLSQDALNYVVSLGREAAPLLQEYVDAPKGLQGRTAANWAALGRASADSYNAKLQDGIPGTVKGPTVTVDADLGPLNRALNTIDTAPIVRRLVVDGVTRTGQRIF